MTPDWPEPDEDAKITFLDDKKQKAYKYTTIAHFNGKNEKPYVLY